MQGVGSACSACHRRLRRDTCLPAPLDGLRAAEFGLIVHNMTAGGVARKVVHKESLLGRDRLRGAAPPPLLPPLLLPLLLPPLPLLLPPLPLPPLLPPLLLLPLLPPPLLPPPLLLLLLRWRQPRQLAELPGLNARRWFLVHPTPPARRGALPAMVYLERAPPLPIPASVRAAPPTGAHPLTLPLPVAAPRRPTQACTLSSWPCSTCWCSPARKPLWGTPSAPCRCWWSTCAPAKASTAAPPTTSRSSTPAYSHTWNLTLHIFTSWATTNQISSRRPPGGRRRRRG